MNNIEVSVWIITYNHEKFIAQSIESALMQKTNFEIEIVIGDDCSTDRTGAIVQEYEKKYPNIIRTVYHKENVGAYRNAYEDTLPLCRGKYIAVLEGDDYWIDPYKLQKQVDCLEKNEKLSFCFHSVLIVNFREIKDTIVARKYFKDKVFKLKDLIKGEGSFVPTLSILFRRSLIPEIPGFLKSAPMGDYFLTLILGDKGDGYYVDQPMAVYRKQVTGSWSENNNKLSDQSLLKQFKEIILSLNSFNDYTLSRHNKLVKNQLLNIGLDLYSKKVIKSKDDLISFGIVIKSLKIYFILRLMNNIKETFWHSIKKIYYKISLYLQISLYGSKE
jgi:glycosyltransferase involved in cell wall biosynthesis